MTEEVKKTEECVLYAMVVVALREKPYVELRSLTYARKVGGALWKHVETPQYGETSKDDIKGAPVGLRQVKDSELPKMGGLLGSVVLGRSKEECAERLKLYYSEQKQRLARELAEVEREEMALLTGVSAAPVGGTPRGFDLNAMLSK